MKNLFLSCFLHLLSCVAFAQSNQVVTLHFDASDYCLSEDSDAIETLANDIIYMEDTSLPAIPFVPIQVRLTDGFTFSTISFSGTKQFFAENVDLKTNPVVFPTNTPVVLDKKSRSQSHDMYIGVYPRENVIFMGVNDFGNIKLANFLVSPWIYNSETDTLELMTTLTLNIGLELSDSQTSLLRESEASLFVDLLSGHRNYLSRRNYVYAGDMQSPIYEYLIITDSLLSNSFVTLRDWKTAKGIRAKIVTTQDIYSAYSDATLPLKIKHYIYDCFQNEGLKYVLLGGDDTFVPVQRCYAEAGGIVDFTMPSDLFYSCFSGSFNWDANCNGICGEVADNVDFTPYLYISRVPVRSNTDVLSFVNKLLRYERNPKCYGWNNNILMGGSQLWNRCYDNTMSDTQAKSERLYRDYIQPYWNGNLTEFYDTYTDFPTGSDYQFSPSNIQDALSLGYTFVDIASHGGPDKWGTEIPGTYYESSHALSLNNPISTIITTMACETNAFDTTPKYQVDPCLSEAFIRNPNSGVIAYLGCSREGWGVNSRNSYLGTSLQYESQYYRYLFDDSLSGLHWGQIVSIAKLKMVPKTKSVGSARWVQLGLNPIGDPEMPVYKSTPLDFTSLSVNTSNDRISLSIGETDSDVCIMSCDDNGDSLYSVYKNVQTITVDTLSQNNQICITKQGYIPKTFIVSSQDIYVQNETLINDFDFVGNRLYMGKHVTDFCTDGIVELKDAHVNLRGNEINLCPGVSLNSNVTLQVNGE